MKNIDESVIALIFSDDRKEVLLIKRRDVPVWVLPGGGIESHETPEAALIREVQEETGYAVDINRKVGEYSPINRLTRFTHLYECHIIGGEAKLGDETQGIKFFPVDALPYHLPPPYDEWIAEGHQEEPGLIQRKLTSITYFRALCHFFLHPILFFRFILSRFGLHLNDFSDRKD